jgi:hypothetical protein
LLKPQYYEPQQAKTQLIDDAGPIDLPIPRTEPGQEEDLDDISDYRVYIPDSSGQKTCADWSRLMDSAGRLPEGL